jgi:hypothetical protein
LLWRLASITDGVAKVEIKVDIQTILWTKAETHVVGEWVFRWGSTMMGK